MYGGGHCVHWASTRDNRGEVHVDGGGEVHVDGGGVKHRKENDFGCGPTFVSVVVEK
jgi:hypothetical protein